MDASGKDESTITEQLRTEPPPHNILYFKATISSSIWIWEITVVINVNIIKDSIKNLQRHQPYALVNGQYFRPFTKVYEMANISHGKGVGYHISLILYNTLTALQHLHPH